MIEAAMNESTGCPPKSKDIWSTRRLGERHLGHRSFEQQGIWVTG